MNVLIDKSKASGKMDAPPSKSMTHRLLICSFLAGGGKISGVGYSEDIKATQQCITALVEGKDELYCGESGSTLRFFIPICLMTGRKITLCGAPRLFERDNSVYEKICLEQNLIFERKDNSITVQGPLAAGEFKVRGDISSQFISGLMFALPLAKGKSRITFTTKLESRPYVDLTIKALSLFGIKTHQTENGFEIDGAQEYKPFDAMVEGDYSNAAFFDALNLVGGEVEVANLKPDSLQGDKIYKKYFKMLCDGAPTLDISDCPDLAPILMAVAAVKNGCELIGTKRLEIKESSRAKVMAGELAKFGVKVNLYENRLTVEGKITKPKEALFGHNDHRIVMALSVLLTVTGGEIKGAQAVSKSLPDFFERLIKLGIKVIQNET